VLASMPINFLIAEACFPRRTGCCPWARSMSRALIRFSFQSLPWVDNTSIKGLVLLGILYECTV
jgi:hypothetical protein